MKFQIKIHRNILHEAIESGYIDIVNLIISLEKIDIRDYLILKKNQYFNLIRNIFFLI